MSGKIIKKESAGRKTALKRNTGRATQVTAETDKPSEDKIRELANEIYQARVMMDEEGSDMEDWLLAEARLSDNQNA